MRRASCRRILAPGALACSVSPINPRLCSLKSRNFSSRPRPEWGGLPRTAVRAILPGRRRPAAHACGMTEGARHHQNETDPLIGRTISGRYRIHKLVGQGGMGKVFEAQQIPLGRSVAVKVLDARHLEREFQRRFLQEAAILARLKSRHTVTIYDYGRDGDQYFIAMEFVPGPSLDRLVATEGPLEVARAVTIAEHVCRSLREAHAQGIIHRDL